MDPWLQRVRHDLLKRALWPARDLAELLEAGRTPTQEELRALRGGLFELRDEQGGACEARGLWARLLQSAPAGMDADALEAFGAGIDSAMNVVAHAAPAAKSDGQPLAGPARGAPSTRVIRDAVEAVLALEPLFRALGGAS